MDSVFSIIAVAVIGLLFAASFLHKLLNFPDFVASVQDYRLLWSGLTLPIAGMLALMELVVVVALVQPGSRGLGAILAIILLLLYATGIGINLLRGRTAVHCGCSWGNDKQFIRPGMLLRNAALAAVAGFILLPSNGRELLWMDWVSVGATTLVFAFFYLAAERLTSFQAKPK
jgi:hypothetical protein